MICQSVPFFCPYLSSGIFQGSYHLHIGGEKMDFPLAEIRLD